MEEWRKGVDAALGTEPGTNGSIEAVLEGVAAAAAAAGVVRRDIDTVPLISDLIQNALVAQESFLCSWPISSKDIICGEAISRANAAEASCFANAAGVTSCAIFGAGFRDAGKSAKVVPMLGSAAEWQTKIFLVFNEGRRKRAKDKKWGKTLETEWF